VKEVIVLFEDARHEITKMFMPHDFVLKLVREDYQDRMDEFDETSSYYEMIKRTTAVPKKGVDKLLNSLDQDLHLLRKRGIVLCVIDEDQIRSKLGLDDRSCRKVVTNRIQEIASGGVHDVVLLDGNLEQLQSVVVEVLNLEASLRKKSTTNRDVVFQEAIRASRDQKTEIRNRYPDLQRLVSSYMSAIDMLVETVD